MNPFSRVPIVPLLGFSAVSLFSFGLACVGLLLAPESLSGDPVRGPVLALTHLITLGWIGSLLCAAAYLVGPMLAENDLWSHRLAALHLALHVVGLSLLLGGFLQERYDIAAWGAGTLGTGLALMIVDLVVTGSRKTRWTPTNITFQTSLFWLAATGAIALLSLRGRLSTPWLAPAETLIAIHAHLALLGFLAQALFGISMRMVPVALGEPRHPARLDALAWAAWGLLNGGLMLLVPAALAGTAGFLVAVGGAIAVGILLFAVDFACVLWLFRRRLSWGVVTHATGIVLLVALLGAALWRLPAVASGSFAQTREWMRFYISLALLGPFSFAIIGAVGRLVPQMVWALRFGPWAAHGGVPRPGSLAREAGAAPAYFSLVMAWVYFVLGQWHDNRDALRLGAVLLITACVWSLITIAPALVRLVTGVTPADLGPPPAPAPTRPPPSR